MDEPKVVFIVNVQPDQLENGKYIPRVSAIRRNNRSYAPVPLEVDAEECFTPLAAVQYGRERAREILDSQQRGNAAIEFIDWENKKE